ncbi:hypothetical protein PV333_31010 [Streptomyces sp. NY05-11A]|nr:hypothetical protein [Streptomyces sp. NY05-11A]MDX2680709.1 hypothetical protein [Streptomyces sp. NY05-11A]
MNHQTAGDTIKNVNMTAFGINIDVIANAVGTYAHDLSSLRSPAPTVRTGSGHGGAKASAAGPTATM